MELEKYRVLLEVLRTGSLSRTAEQNHYTVSGISRMMATLEKEQGFTLLERQHDGVRPTRACEALLPTLQELLHQGEILDQLSEGIRGAQVGSISIGVAYSRHYLWLAEQVEAFRGKHPGVSFSFQSGYSSELLEQLYQHRLDLCLISQREGGHEWLPWGEEELVAWVPDGHELSREDGVPLSVFESEPFIDIYPERDIDNRRVFEKYGIRPNIAINTQDSFAVYSMVEAGLGISMNHRSSCSRWSGAVTVLPLKPPLSVPIGFASLPNATPVTRAFLQALQASR